jgi:hypothetical protein
VHRPPSLVKSPAATPEDNSREGGSMAYRVK